METQPTKMITNERGEVAVFGWIDQTDPDAVDLNGKPAQRWDDGFHVFRLVRVAPWRFDDELIRCSLDWRLQRSVGKVWEPRVERKNVVWVNIRRPFVIIQKCPVTGAEPPTVLYLDEFVMGPSEVPPSIDWFVSANAFVVGGLCAETSPTNLAKRFLEKDGDHAVGTRVARFLCE